MNKDKHFYNWVKGESTQLSPHFTTNEFTCLCRFSTCINQRTSIELIARLELLHIKFGKPITVTSGFRCHEYQIDLGQRGYETAKIISQHELGMAADIVSSNLKDLAKLSDPLFKAMGVGKTFIHVDMREDKLRRWTYART